MIIFRYLAKEVFVTLISLTAILLLIFMSNQFIQYLNRAAAGRIPGVIIMKLMMLEMPNLMALLLPLGFFVSLLLAYGRLYADSEMTVLRACGYGPNQLLKHSMYMACVVAAVAAAVMVWASPYIAIERAKLLRSSGVQTLIQTISPGRFHAIDRGTKVFYVQSISRDHLQASDIFLVKQTLKNEKLQWDVLWADKAYAETDPTDDEDYLVFKNGKEYQGVPGEATYQVSQFSQSKVRLPHPVISNINEDVRTAQTASLWPINNADKSKAAELQWRLSVPIMILTLTLVGVPLSRVSPRSGKFAKLFPAIIIFILYADAIFTAKSAIGSGKIPVWLGLWWVHVLVILLGLFLIWRNQVKLS